MRSPEDEPQSIRLFIFVILQPSVASNTRPDLLHRTFRVSCSEFVGLFRALLWATLLEGAVVHSQLATIHLLAVKLLPACDGAFDVHEVCMCEASWLASPSVDGNPDIEDIADITEELVEIGIGHLEGEVADEEGLGWGALCLGTIGLGHVVHDQLPAFERRLVFSIDGSFSLLHGLELNVSESRTGGQRAIQTKRT